MVPKFKKFDDFNLTRTMSMEIYEMVHIMHLYIFGNFVITHKKAAKRYGISNMEEFTVERNTGDNSYDYPYIIREMCTRGYSKPCEEWPFKKWIALHNYMVNEYEAWCSEQRCNYNSSFRRNA